MKVQGKVALITGGTKGIGLGITRSLLDEGMKVAITGRDQASLDKVVKKLGQWSTGRVIGIEADVRDYAAQESAVGRILSKWGRLDVVVANAGVGHFSPVQEISVEDWKEVIDINLTGAFYTVKATAGALQDSQGYLITIASLAGTNFFPGGSAYNASKFGLVGFTQAAMLDLRPYGIKTTTIMPGSVATYFNDRVPGMEDAWKIQPEDLGQMVVDLLKMHPRTLPSKVEVRPTIPPSAKK